MQTVNAATGLKDEEPEEPGGNKEDDDEDDFKDAVEFDQGSAQEGSELAAAALAAKEVLEARRAAQQVCQDARAKWAEAKAKEANAKAKDEETEKEPEEDLDKQGDGIMRDAVGPTKRGASQDEQSQGGHRAEPDLKKGKKEVKPKVFIDLGEGEENTIELQREVEDFNAAASSQGNKGKKTKEQQEQDDKKKQARAVDLIRSVDAKVVVAKQLGSRSRSPVPRGDKRDL